MRLATIAIIAAALAGCGDNIAGSSAKAVSEFEFLVANNPQLSADIRATITGPEIAAVVPFGTDVRHLVATFDTAGVAVAVAGTDQRSGVTANDFTGAVAYRVTAEDASATTYTVTVTVAADDAKRLTAFAFFAATNPGLATDIHGAIVDDAATLTVPYGSDVRHLVATFETDGAAVSVAGAAQASGATANDFTSPVTYTVTAADGSRTDYLVTVVIALASAADITSFAFLAADNPALAADVPGSIVVPAITANVPYNTDVTALVATFTIDGLSIAIDGTPQVSGVTVNDFTSPVTYTVTAADGSTQLYAVTVKIADNPAKDITAFAFLAADNPGLAADVVATITGTAIAATVPAGTDVHALVASFTTTGASVSIGGVTQISGVTANDFAQPVDYTVTAADITTQDYFVTVTVQP